MERSDGSRSLLPRASAYRTVDIADHTTSASATRFDPNPPDVEKSSARLAPRFGDSVRVFGGLGQDLRVVDALVAEGGPTLVAGNEVGRLRLMAERP
jgi:hypothetical protein